MELLSGTTTEMLWQIVVWLLGAGGCWKLIELVANFRSVQREKLANAKNLDAQSQSQIIKNQLAWADRLEARIKDLEKVAELNGILTQKVAKLQGEVRTLKIENKELRKQVKILSGKK